MTRFKDREKAIQLRKQGKTYSEILNMLNIPKSTLSGWLSDFPLTKWQFAVLEENIKKRKFLSIEKMRRTMARMRKDRLQKLYRSEKKRLLPLRKREVYLAGLFLYWGEGVKGLKAAVGLNNTDPKVVKFYLHWLTNCLGVPKNELKAYVHLYEDMDVDQSMGFWSRELSIPKKQFLKPYIKASKRENLTHKGYGHGTCGLYVYDTRLKEKIMLGIEAVADNYSKLATG